MTTPQEATPEPAPVKLSNLQFFILYIDGKKTYIVAALGLIFNAVSPFVVAAYPWSAPFVNGINAGLVFCGFGAARHAIAKGK